MIARAMKVCHHNSFRMTRRYQRPRLAALPAGGDLRWSINGEPAEDWVPSPGVHTVAVARGEMTDEIEITYE